VFLLFGVELSNKTKKRLPEQTEISQKAKVSAFMLFLFFCVGVLHDDL